MFGALTRAFAVLQLALPLALASFGTDQPIYGFPTPEGSYIVDMTTTLQLPNRPDMPKGSMSVWMALVTTKDFLQHISLPTHFGSCDNVEYGNAWCNYGYLLDCDAKDIHTCPPAVARPAATVPGNTAINIRYHWDEKTGDITQTATQNGKTLTTLNAGQGRGVDWYAAIECHDCGPMTMAARSYVDTTFVLDKPNPTWTPKNPLNGMKYGSFNTVDGGQTWVMDWMHFDAFHFTEVTTLSDLRNTWKQAC
ncbi:hypothetical protein EJ08DRAFT_680816 [Tothia fuscella]|uniref:Uncharacterized protein n=1 Tax=Tothia fuscella TaxID=1048955 RepID=A0A9P4TWI3_9PEZI|nr:hypothetical protein EJ08DRAFT_680816 [Tothia fuscella]